MPKVGAKATCRLCGGAIYWSGKYWAHEGKNVRHPGSPMKEERDDAASAAEAEADDHTEYDPDLSVS